MFGLFRISKARKTASARILPLIEYSQQSYGPIPDTVWRAPYMIGFVSTLISLMAQSELHGQLTSDQLGMVQLESWPEITGQSDPTIGETICELSDERNVIFIEGCLNARRFLAALDGRPELDDPAISEYICSNNGDPDINVELSRHADVFGLGGSLAASLWACCFERHLH